MGTRPRPRYAESSDQLADALRVAIEPVTSELKELRNDIKQLELTTVARTDVYDRSVMDEKLKQVHAEIEQATGATKSIKEFVYKVLGATYTVVMLWIVLSQYLGKH